ncbi:slowpoke-binding protein-like, partial [Saccoglossus kowalevskii]
LPILGGVLLLAVVCLLVVWLVCKWRNSRNYDYSALEHEMGLSERLRIEREQQYEAKRESALLNCQFYLRSMAGQYTMVEQLPNIGTRVNKDWFLVQDKRSKSTKLLTMSIRSSGCPIKLTKTNRKTLKEMLQLIHHPYLLPMDDVDFVAEQDLIVVVQHYNHNGSLKDIIYKSKPYQDVENKYSTVGYGLSLYQIQLYGKQVLEALIYLDDHGINIQGHVQSGNIIIENDTCRLCGYENILLGFTARSHHAIRRRLRDGKDGGDRLAFGVRKD